MKAHEAFEILGNKLENEYKHLKFKYSKNNKWLKKSTKQFNYYVFFTSFSGNIPDKDVALKVCFSAEDKTLTSVRSNVHDQLFFIDLWDVGNFYNVATNELIDNAFIDIKNKMEKYLIPFIDKFEKDINKFRDEWVEHGFLHDLSEFGLCTNLQFINKEFGRECAKKSLTFYLKILDKENLEIFKKTYKKSLVSKINPTFTIRTPN